MSDRFARFTARAGLRKSVVILASGFVLALALLQTLNLWSRYRQTVAITELKATDLSYILAENMQRSVGAVDASLKQLVQNNTLVGGPNASHDAWDPALKAAIAGLSYVGSLNVTDANGVIRQSTFPSLVGQSRSDDFLFRQLAADSNAGIIADKPFLSRIDQRVIIPLGRRLISADGSFQGTVVATLVPAAFRDFYSSIDIGSQGFIWVMHSTGQIFFREPALEGVDLANPASLPLSQHEMNSAGVVHRPLQTGGPGYITGWHAVKEPPIIIAVSLNRSEALQTWRRDAWWSLGLTTLVAFVMAAGSIQLLRQLDLRAAVELSLLKREQELMAAQRVAGLASARFTGADLMAHVSPQLATLLGLTAGSAEMTFDKLLDQLVEADRAKLQEALKACVEFGKPWQLEIQVKSDNGSNRILLTEGGKQIESSAKDTDVLAIFQDVTEHRLVEQRSIQAERLAAIGRLTGGVAHDFNNLLTVIIGRSELLLANLPPESPTRTSIHEIDRAAQRAAGLTRQLLAFSRKQLLQLKVIDLNAAISDIEQMLNRLIGEDIELVLKLDSSLGRIRADQGQIEQVIMNLVVNSRDAMPNGGNLMIETSNIELDENYARNHVAVEPGAYVLLAVSDTGTGIEKEIQEHIFEPFFSTKPAGKGTGLGLATAYGIIKQSGGNIWVYSEPGKGTTFKIYLPRVDDVDKAKDNNIQKRVVTQGSETILLVEDEDSLRKLAQDVLAMHGYTVMTAPNAKQALEIYHGHGAKIDLVLTDVVMPGASGRELAEQLKAVEPELKVLYMSGYTGDVVVLHAAFEDGIDFIQKPFSPDSLAEKVREVLDRK